jgi:hypothetical protein
MKSSGLCIISVLLALGLVAPACGVPLDAPSATLLTADRTSVTLRVQAGSSGAPAGFIVEWLPADQYRALGGWPVSAASVSGSGFTGVPTLNVTPGVESFRLGAGQVAEVVIGELFDETGLEGSDSKELADGTEYVVRVRAAAGGPGLEQSANSTTIACRTSPRTSTDCTVSQGYWKNHPESWSRVPTLTLGSVSYTQAQILAILRQPARGNGLVSLAHQLIATRLNLLLGAVPPASVSLAVDLADETIGTLVVPPLGGGRLLPCSTSGLTWTFREFNTGSIGPGHCPSDLRIVSATSPTWGTLKSIYR